MEESAVRLMEGYEETLDQCGLFLLEEEDLIVEHHIFEEFDIGVYSFFMNRILSNCMQQV